MRRKVYCTQYYGARITNPVLPLCKINGENPYDEQVMSLPGIMDGESEVVDCSACLTNSTVIEGHYFFFIYNLENYYHFLYDTLPYLWFYRDIIRHSSTRPKLLIANGHRFLPFQEEILSLLGFNCKEDTVEAIDNAVYECLFVPSSLTHGHLLNGKPASNMMPESVVYSIWRELCITSVPSVSSLPKKIYVSRRTHLHNDMSNIGTNYTTRRRCLNEDDVVASVEEKGYVEVFCEKLSTSDKITMFNNATHIIGFIGGGMANLLFSPNTVSVGCILTPEFIQINDRFRYSMDHTDITYLDICRLAPHEGVMSPYTRVKVKDVSSPYYNKIGEVYSYDSMSNTYEVHISMVPVAGFRLGMDLEKTYFSKEQLHQLDNGLNSPFTCDTESLKKYLSSL